MCVGELHDSSCSNLEPGRFEQMSGSLREKQVPDPTEIKAKLLTPFIRFVAEVMV